MSNRRTQKLERDATADFFDSIGPFFVVVDGGVCQYVGTEQIDLLNTGRAQLIDFDNLEADPQGTWDAMSDAAKDFFKATYPEELKKYKFRSL